MIRLQLYSVQINLRQKSYDVCWMNQFVEVDEFGGEVIHSEVPHRKSYSLDMKNEFLLEVEDAQRFIDLLEPKIEVTDGV